MPAQRILVTPQVSQLAFSMVVPEDFRQLPIPADVPDFSNPTEMLPLAVFMAGYGAVLASVAARPLMADGSDGSLMDRAMALAAHQMATAGGQVRKLMPVPMWGTTVVEVEATQPSDAGEMIVRAVFLEDGGTLYNIAMMAPAALWGAVEKTLTDMVASFALQTPQGPTRGIAPGQAPPAPAVFAAPVPTAAPQPPAPEPTPAAVPAPASAPATSGTAATGAPPEGPDLQPYALDDPHALDPEETLNARFRDAGAGLVPRVLAQNPRHILVGLGALEAILPVPPGWHVVDDGRRALVFDRGNAVQVSLTLINIQGQSPPDVFNAVLDDLRTGSPDLEHRELEIESFNVMHVRKLVIDGTPLQQAYLLRPHPLKEHLGLKIRVTATEENLPRAMDMTGIMAAGLRFM